MHRLFFILSTSFLLCCKVTGQVNLIKGEIEKYLVYRSGKMEGLKINQENTGKFIKSANKALKTFALNKEVNKTDSFRVASNNKRIKFISLQGIAEVSIHYFNTGGRELEVYAYTSRDLENYMIIDKNANSILFEGDGVSYLVDSIYEIDKSHYLVVEKFGDVNSSRRVQVLKNGKIWLPVNAFYGMTEPGTKPLFRRYFKLHCDFTHTILARRDINKVTYLPGEKTITLRVYSDEQKFKEVKSAWMNGIFKLDDVDVSETFEGYNIGLPVE